MVILMATSQTFIEISKDELLHQARLRKLDGWRLTVISVTSLPEYDDLLYTFEKDYEMVNLRVSLLKGAEVQSVSHVYQYAYLYENEMYDLFGIPVDGMNIDFAGKLYQTPVTAPFAVKTVESEEVKNG